jgi:hypothetical protein
MNAPYRPFAPSVQPVFDARARRVFAAHYPDCAHRLSHGLARHPLLEIPALAELAARLPQTSVEWGRDDLALGATREPGLTGISVTETILGIARTQGWAMLGHVERVPSYAALVQDLFGELAPEIEAKTGTVLTPAASIHIASPNAVTPIRYERDHLIMIQVAGSRVMTQLPPDDPRFAHDRNDALVKHGDRFELRPGDAIHVPVMAPHIVRNGPEISVSLSLSWASEWSRADSDARRFDALARRVGYSPPPPPRWPARSRARTLAWRAYRRLFGEV